jgi:2,4-dienoyl-CoA reductase-like NADH-dependent reductase (Old Yellow Enzyme family)
MATNLDEDGYIGETARAYHWRAEGGVGTITVESLLVSPDSVGPERRSPDDRYVPGLRDLVGDLHGRQVTVGVRLTHPGRQVVEGPSVAPSPAPLPAAAPAPHGLAVGEIAAIVDDYARAAQRQDRWLRPRRSP